MFSRLIFWCFIIFWPHQGTLGMDHLSFRIKNSVVCLVSSVPFHLKYDFLWRGPAYFCCGGLAAADTRYGRPVGLMGSSYLLSFVAINDRPLYGRRHPYRNLLCTVCSSSSIVGTYSVSDIGYIHQNLGLVIQKSFITCVCINKLFRSPFFEQLF